jgi:hypothetical protein
MRIMLSFCTLIHKPNINLTEVHPVNGEIREAALKALIEANSISGASVYGQRGGFEVRIVCGPYSKTLVAARGGIRLFGSLDTAMAFLRRLGVFCFDVDTTTYEEALLRKPRPDRAAALRQTKTKLKQSDLW